MCRVVTPPSASSPVRRPLTNLFQKCRKLGILPELPGKLLIIFAGEFFMEKYSDNFEENVKYFGELVQPDKNFDMIVKKLK